MKHRVRHRATLGAPGASGRAACAAQFHVPVRVLPILTAVDPAGQQQWAGLAGMSNCQNGALRASSPGSSTST